MIQSKKERKKEREIIELFRVVFFRFENLVFS